MDEHKALTLGGQWPAELPLELAVRAAELRADPAKEDAIRVGYGYTPEEWVALQNNPTLLSEIKYHLDLLKADGGYGVRAKARALAENALPRLYAIAMDEASPPATSVSAIALLAKWGGVDAAPKEAPAPAPSTTVNFLNMAPSDVPAEVLGRVRGLLEQLRPPSMAELRHGAVDD